MKLQRSIHSILRCLPVLALAASLSACGTPQPARDLAIALITRLADRSKLMREERETAFVAKAKQLEDARGPAIKASNTNLAEARKAFIVLSQELSPSEWFKFAQSYVKQVRADLKALEAAEAADATPATAPAQPAAP
jgi:hypothetical protein